MCFNFFAARCRYVSCILLSRSRMACSVWAVSILLEILNVTIVLTFFFFLNLNHIRNRTSYSVTSNFTLLLPSFSVCI
jgi:hypothetical protein